MKAYHTLALPIHERRQVLSKSAFLGGLGSAISGLGKDQSGRGYLQRKLIDPMWNAGAASVKSLATDASNAAKGLYANAATAVDNGIDKGLNFVNDNISQPMQQAGQAVADGAKGLYADARNAVDSGVDKSLDFVNRNISAPMYGAIQGAQQGYAAANPTPQAAPMTPPPAVGPPAPPPAVGPPAPGSPSSAPFSGPGAPPVAPPTQASIAAPPRAIPVAGQPPAQPDYMAQFRQQHGTAFDPNSSMDRAKMQMMQKGASELWGEIKADLEKEAAAQLIAKGLGAAGSKLKSLGSAAKGRVGRAEFERLGGPAMKQTVKDNAPSAVLGSSAPGAAGNEAAKLVGNKRIGLGKKLTGLGRKVETGGLGALAPGLKSKALSVLDSPLATSLTTGAAGFGLGGVLGERGGIEQGKAEGLEAGATKGFDAGLQAGAQKGGIDPGILGRLLEVFTGRPQVSLQDPELAAQRQAAITRILSGKA